VREAERLPPLYPIIDVRDDSPRASERALALTVELCGAGATLLQLRAKRMPAGAMTALAGRMVQAAAANYCRVIVNDRADVALAVGAAGVHLGDEDVPVAAAREMLGAGAIIGYSTHCLKDVAEAAGFPVDYIGFGPVFDSPTKAGAREPRGVDLLAAVCAVSKLPVVAIGGVTLATAEACWRAGAASVAVISEIEHARDRAALVRAYRRAAARAGTASPS
jgi:thiamine-phosphate diphosphorylase